MTFTVTTLADDQTYDGGDLAAETADGGGLTLREALGLANFAADADTIDFAAGLLGGTLTLAQGELAISQSVAIDGDINGDGVSDITVDAHGDSRVFNIADATGDVALNGLVIENGNVSGLSNAGGGVRLGGGANLTLSNSLIAGNTASGHGGGIYGADSSAVTLVNSTVSGNHAVLGGGVFVNDNASLTVVNTTVARNAAVLHGGGLFCDFDSTATLVNATISGNLAVHGDGGGIYGVGGNIFTLINSTVTGNRANGYGGNGNGGGLYMWGSLTTLTNSIVAGNLATESGNDLYGGVAAFSQLVFTGPSIIGSTPVSFLATHTTNGTIILIDGANQAALETVFASVGNDAHTGVLAGVLADNGGPVATVALNPTGIAHDTGSNGDLPTDVHDLDDDGDTAEPLPVDARGLNRVAGAGVDLGANEFHIAPSATSLTQVKSYVEGAASVALDDIVVSDPEPDATITATLTLANPAAGLLTVSGGATYNALTGVWTVTGTVAAVNVALAAVAFAPAAGNLVDATVSVHIRDAANAGPADGTITLDINLAPVISSGGGGATAAVSVAENATSIATILAVDPDGPGITFALAGGADAAKFTIDAATGSLAFAAAPDFEGPTDADGNDVYEVVVQVSDGAGGIDQQALSVSVSDVNGVRIDGTDGNDIVKPGKTVAGEPFPTGEEDRIFGFFGDDQLAGGGGDDALIGSRGNDRLVGGEGNDGLAGGFGRNVLIGGADADRFIFNERLGVGVSLGFDDPLGHSRIVGFTVGVDKIVLAEAVFKSLAHIDYDAATGALTFDSGAPGGDRFQFATLAKNLAISDGDFVLV